jgi:hypothetical protein
VLTSLEAYQYNENDPICEGTVTDMCIVIEGRVGIMNGMDYNKVRKMVKFKAPIEEDSDFDDALDEFLLGPKEDVPNDAPQVNE